MNKLCFSLLLLFFIACSNQSGTNITSLPKPKIISPEFLPHEFIMTFPLEVKSFGDFLFFTQPMPGKPILFYNRKTGQDHLWGSSGSGPDDFGAASCAYQNYEDNIIEIYDTNLRKLVSYKTHIEDNSVTLIPEKRYRVDTGSLFTFGLHKMDNGYYVSLVMLGHENMFVMFDKDLKVFKTFGNKPIEEMPDDNFSYLWGWFASVGNKLYFASQTTGYLACYEISDNGDVKKDWEANYTVPKYETAPSFSWKRDNQQGFYDIQVNNEWLFLSFSGKSFEEENVIPQNILVLTHDGKIKKNIMFDNDHLVGKFTVVGDTIFAVGLEQITKFNWRKTL